MGKIIAIGGGEIGRPGTSIETLDIDKEIIRLSGKKKPKLLFLPTASGDSDGYCDVVEKYFGQKLGCVVDCLKLFDRNIERSVIRKKILEADIVYVGGGNTLRMMKIWRKRGVDEILLEAYQKGVVMSGTSAGAICWFEFAHSDSRKFSQGSDDYIRVRGLGLLPGWCCPHYDVEKSRQSSLKRMLQKYGGQAFALENCSALEVVDDKYRIIYSKKTSNAYKLYRSKGEYIQEKLERDGEWKPIERNTEFII